VTGDIGARLRRAREQRGMSLRDAANQTKLSITVLQAIERNDFGSLPGGMFRKAYVRTLAEQFGLDPDALAADYCAQFEPPIQPVTEDPQAGLQQQLIEQLAPSPRRSIVTLFLLAAPAAAWFLLQSEPVIPTVPRDDFATEFVAASIPGGGGSITLTADRPQATARTAMAAQAMDAPLRIELAATGWCWVAAETDGERVMYRLIQPGERVVFEGQRLIAVRLGDAGAVTVSINGGPTRSLGSDGEVAELEITPDNVDGLRDVAIVSG
jgi:transcriptional regulator with XRE-family HTH domain